MEKATAVLNELFNKDPNVRQLLSPSQEELRGLNDAIGRVRPKYTMDPTNHEVVFEYARLLISHSRASYIEEGVRLVESLICAAWKQQWDGAAHTQLDEAVRLAGEPELPHSDIPRGEVHVSASAPPEGLQDGDVAATDSKTGRRNIRPTADIAIHYYYLALGWIKLHDYEKALTSVNQMLRLEPQHRQGIALKHYIDAEVKQTLTATGLAGVGIIAAVAVVVGALLRKS
ncbi:hypothetical protein DQ04_01241140 [Trypanosoma grayi]|uniref:hypothetical protein n=1 Tax=Trypanosoma grayi TaxID=71804 RepID=UPI0004F40366|nr:hypothetical protein DQ04_01241140 [Trypanosoma grayi]KEG13059.1 hypothetical protein DQ04_01241140 [Trypanosoma grayi]